MAATRYWSVEECRWVDSPVAHVPEQATSAADDELSGLPRQRGLEELRDRTREGVEG